ncbi:MAG: carboxylating nicotinate-nucleotide diphosphorylase [Armatimonadetes bacterium]|nr:carboxylating nicotinate-nucleotide diphosphorylase [Armatimonadota bacterium]MDE2205879.1 carboxylating nicotinate-nucleotide diphosphorylase [Armatimonadota bacterium]
MKHQIDGDFGLPECGDTIRHALREDVGWADITSLFTVPEDAAATAVITAKEPGVVAGLGVAAAVFEAVDSDIAFLASLEEGAVFESGAALCTVAGRARSLLSGERVALNFLQRLSGIATLTRAFVDRIGGSDARIVDTRKTAPGLRALEKYAVRVGGGFNHRMGLFDAVLIKENHISAAGGIAAAVAAAYQRASHVVTVTVECRTLDQVRQAVEADVDIVLLDNMSPDTMREAVETYPDVSMEASGGVSLDNVADIAATGVRIISVGALTHSSRALDLSMILSLQHAG